MKFADYVPISLELEINRPDIYDTHVGITLDSPVIYKGWQIYRWTGWKGCWAMRSPWSISKNFCEGCYKVIECGQWVYLSWNSDLLCHFNHHDTYHGEIHGQWLAWRLGSHGQPVRHAYASAPGGQGVFNPGDFFDLGPGPRVTYFTNFDILKELRDEAYQRLLGVIDAHV